MGLRTSSSLFLWAALVSNVHGESYCAARPLSLAVTNVTLTNGQIARGVELGVGTPSQSMAFLPQWPLNNTFVYGTSGYCNSVESGWLTDGCTTFRGGAYDPTSSSTQQGGAASAFAPDTGSYPNLTEVSDTVILGSNVTLKSFPFGIVLNDWGEQGYHPQAALGLGPNSTLLSTLVDSGTIASRTWSWFWGLNGPSDSTQLSGSLVLGGYDKAKVSGTGFTQALSTNPERCDTGLFVTLSDITLNFVDGTSSSLFPDASPTSLLAACLDPAYPTLTTIPLNPYFSNFENLTNATISGRSKGLNWYNMRYDANQTSFNGDITLEFATGLSIRIDNSQFVGPDVTINRETGATEANNTEPDLAMIALQGINSNDVIRIGRNFFSAAYISVNYDVGEFTVWAANATEHQALVAVDSTGAEVDSSCDTNNGTAVVTAGGAAPSSADGSNTAKDSGESSENSGPPVSGIVGGVVGGVVGIIAISGLTWWLLRRRKAAEANLSKPGTSNDVTELEGADRTDTDFTTLTKFEPVRDSQLNALHELPIPERKRYELPSSTVVYEMES